MELEDELGPTKVCVNGSGPLRTTTDALRYQIPVMITTYEDVYREM